MAPEMIMAALTVPGRCIEDGCLVDVAGFSRCADDRYDAIMVLDQPSRSDG